MKNMLFKNKAKRFTLSFIFLLIGMFMTSFCFAAGDDSNDIATTQAVENRAKQRSVGDGLGYMAAALAIGAGSVAAGIAVASAAPAALGAFSEDPTSFGKTIVFVALGEGVSILSFIAAMMIISGLNQ